MKKRKRPSDSDSDSPAVILALASRLRSDALIPTLWSLKCTTHNPPPPHTQNDQAAGRAAASANSSSTSIAILSDTHGVLDATVVALLRDRGVAHILHGGDIGPGRHKGKDRLPAAELLGRLAAVAPVSAIAGNVDEDGGKAAAAALEALTRPGLRVSTAATVECEVAGLRFWLSHGHRFPIKPAVGADGGALTLPAPPNEAAKRIAAAKPQPQIVVCGHTHQPIVGRLDGLGDPIVFVNPGSAGPRRFSLPRSFAILSVESIVETISSKISGARRRRRVSVDRFECCRAGDGWAVVDTQEFVI